MSETHIVKLAAKINKLLGHANIQRIGIPSDLTVRREKFLQFIRTNKCALESFTVTSNILATFELDGRIHKPYTTSVDKALWKSLYGHIQSTTLDSLHEHHGSGYSMLLALQRKCANIDEDNREYLEDRFKACRMAQKRKRHWLSHQTSKLLPQSEAGGGNHHTWKIPKSPLFSHEEKSHLQ